MTYHSPGADRFRDLAGDDAYRSWLISRNQPPIVHHSTEVQWKRLSLLARRIVGFLAAQRVAVVASRARRLRHHPAFRSYDHPPKVQTKARTADRSRP